MIHTTLPAKRKRPRRANRRKKTAQPFGSGASHGLKRAAISIGIVLSAGALLVALLFGYRCIASTDHLALTEIVVTGTDHLSYGDVLAAGRVSLGNNLLALNVTAVQARLAKNPWVADVSVRRELFHKLIIDIEEREAKFWTVSGKRLYYCDGTGRLIAAVTPGEFHSLPVLDLPATMHGKMKMLPALLKALEASSLPSSQNKIAAIKLNESGQVECLLDQTGLTLKFSMNNHQVQLGRMQRVVADLQRRGEFAQVAMITAGPDRIWVTKRTTIPDTSG